MKTYDGYKVIKKPLTNKYLELWENALKYKSTTTLEESACLELSEYFGISKEQALDRMMKGGDDFANLWRRSNIDLKNEKQLIEFYNKDSIEIFELMEWNYLRYTDGCIVYAAAYYLARKLGVRNYLDFGSGVGLGALLFSKDGFKVSLADIADPLIKFVKWRLYNRGIKACIYNLKNEQLPENSFDFVTCFDVLEHVKSPLSILRMLWKKLAPGGILLVNAEFKPSNEHPMHIITDKKITKKFRAQGFDIIYSYNKIFDEANPYATVLVLKKVERNKIFNTILLLYDYYLPSCAHEFIKWIRNILLNRKKYE